MVRDEFNFSWPIDGKICAMLDISPHILLRYQQTLLSSGTFHVDIIEIIEEKIRRSPLFREIHAPLAPLPCHKDSFVIGEMHSDIFSKEMLIRNLPILAAAGYKTIYLEHIPGDIFNGLLRKIFCEKKRITTEPLLMHFLTQLSLGQFRKRYSRKLPGDTDNYQTYLRNNYKLFNYLSLVDAAYSHGIRVIGLDTTLSYATDTLRHHAFSWQAYQVIKETHENNKWVALVGNSHAIQFAGVAGVSEICQVKAINICDPRVFSSQQEEDLYLSSMRVSGDYYFNEGQKFWNYDDFKRRERKQAIVINIPPIDANQRAHIPNLLQVLSGSSV